MIVVYTRDGCSRCATVKSQLLSWNVPYTEKKIGIDIDREVILEQFPGVKELPIVVTGESVVELSRLRLLYGPIEPTLLNEAKYST